MDILIWLLVINQQEKEGKSNRKQLQQNQQYIARPTTELLNVFSHEPWTCRHLLFSSLLPRFSSCSYNSFGSYALMSACNQSFIAALPLADLKVCHIQPINVGLNVDLFSNNGLILQFISAKS